MEYPMARAITEARIIYGHIKKHTGVDDAKKEIVCAMAQTILKCVLLLDFEVMKEENNYQFKFIRLY